MPKSPIIDIGANLTHPDLYPDIKKIIRQMEDVNVTHAIIISSTLDDAKKAIAISDKYKGKFYTTVGFHPHNAKEFNHSHIQSMKDLLRNQFVRSIGECGLDYYRLYSEKKEQILCFENHISLAIDSQMPLFLHERNAHDDFYAILSSEYRKLNKFVVHCFTGDKNVLKKYLDIGSYIGITGWITDKDRGSHLHNIMKYIPSDRLMIETDSPYLIPHNIERNVSKTNYPYYLPYVVSCLAKCLNKDVDTVRESTYKVTKEFFSIDD